MDWHINPYAVQLVIPASFAAYLSGLHYASWLPPSARARVILWEYTAEQTLTNPFLGVGVGSNSDTRRTPERSRCS